MYLSHEFLKASLEIDIFRFVLEKKIENTKI